MPRVRDGAHKRGEWTLISAHQSVSEAFDAIDALSARMAQTGAPTDAIELLVVDEHGTAVGGYPRHRRHLADAVLRLPRMRYFAGFTAARSRHNTRPPTLEQPNPRSDHRHFHARDRDTCLW